MSIFDAFTKKKPAAIGDDFHDEVAKLARKHAPAEKAREKRQIQIDECSAVLNDCRLSFDKSILMENALAAESRRMGYEPHKQREHIREAAIGIAITEMAQLELQSITSEADLNSAMNKMGMALRQLKHLDNKTAAISARTERIVEQWYPGAFSQQGEAEDGAALPVMEVPESVRAMIDDAFVQNIMDGDSYAVAKLKHQLQPSAPVRPDIPERPRVDTDAILNEVRNAVNQEPSSERDVSAILQQHSMNKF